MTLSRSYLHHRAAAYYQAISPDSDSWKSYVDIEYKLLEFDHLYLAHSYNKSCELLLSIDEFLRRWGFYETIKSKYEMLIDKVDDKYLRMRVLLNLGRLYRRTRFTTNLRIVEMHQEALSLAETPEDRINAINHLGNDYYEWGKNSTAIKYYQQCLENLDSIDIEFNRELRRAHSIGNIAHCHVAMGNYLQAESLYSDILEKFIKLDVELDIAEAKRGLGHVALLKKDYGKSARILSEALQIEKLHNRVSGSFTAFYLSLALVLLNRIDEASQNIEHFLSADNLEPRSLSNLLNIKAIIELNSKRFNQAVSFFQNSHDNASNLLKIDREDFRAAYARLIAIGGLMICGVETYSTDIMQKEFIHAKSITNDLGIIELHNIQYKLLLTHDLNSVLPMLELTD